MILMIASPNVVVIVREKTSFQSTMHIVPIAAPPRRESPRTSSPSSVAAADHHRNSVHLQSADVSAILLSEADTIEKELGVEEGPEPGVVVIRFTPPAAGSVRLAVSCAGLSATASFDVMEV